MRYFALAFIAILLFICTGCSSSTKTSASQLSMLKCQEELERIPEVAAWRKSRRKQPEQTENQPLAGMELVLTINRMVGKEINPQADEDDLCYTENTVDNFNKLVGALKENDIPPTVDFIVGRSFDPEIQEAWLSGGNLLGNMTYSRTKPKKATTQEVIEDIDRNERALAPLWKKFPPKQKYFRFPGLTLDRDQQKLAQIRAFLKQRGYVEVPATIDAQDDLLSQSYCAALARGDKACAALIRSTFKSFLLDRTLRAREAAQTLAGSDVKHILMIKANQLTCDMLGELLAWYKALGARFVSLDTVLRDPFYATGNATGRANEVIAETERALHSGNGE